LGHFDLIAQTFENPILSGVELVFAAHTPTSARRTAAKRQAALRPDLTVISTRRTSLLGRSASWEMELAHPDSDRISEKLIPSP
jgi:hypothetical protein